jgi:hypothetical protein
MAMLNAKRLTPAILAVFAVSFLGDYLLHACWLESAFRETSYDLWRPDPEMRDRVVWIFTGHLLAAGVFVVLWGIGFANRATLKAAILFGMAMGLFRQADTLIDFAVHPLPGNAVFKAFLARVAVSMLMGLIAFAVYRPVPEERRQAAKASLRRWVACPVGTVALLAAVKTFFFAGSPEVNIEPMAPWMTPLKSTWATESPGLAHSIQSVSDVTRNGEASLRFELRKGDAFKDSLGRSTYRAEVDTKDFPPMRSVRWYAFSMYLPEDFPKEDNWLVLAQWHGVDKRHLGEASRIPAMQFSYRGERFRLMIRHSAERILKEEEGSAKETPFSTTSLPHGRWNDFVVQAKWSYENDGFVNAWLNGEQIVKYRGPVGYNDDVGPYFRFGLYRGMTDKTHVVYFSQVRSGVNAEEIGLKPEIVFHPSE